jgi:dTDP-glucose 4,6-dehydratase
VNRILVTGGAGFIGCNFIYYLLKNRPDYFVVNYDALTYAGNLRNLKSIEKNDNYAFVKGDIRDFETLDKIIQKHNISGIINFAAESHVDRSILNPDLFIQTNVVGVQSLLNAAKKNNIKTFLQISTDEVYGSLGQDDPAFTENSPITTNSPYSASKAAGDLLAFSYYKTFGVPVKITRCANNYGPFQFPEKLIPLMINNILSNKEIPIYGDGKNIRDWIYVDDHCEGVLSVFEKGRIGEVYNLGGGYETSNIELAKKIIKELNASEDLITFVKDRPGHDFRYALNYSKAKKELGWSPKFSFDKAIKKTIKWYTENRDWLKSVISGEYMNYYKLQYGGN